MRSVKDGRDFDTLVRRATARGRPVHEHTLRRALHSRRPTLKAVLAFAAGAGADEKKAEQLWAAAVRADRLAQPRTCHTPGRVTTQAGLVRAMDRMRVAAGAPSLRELAAAAPDFLSRSALSVALRGEKLPSERLLTGFAEACGATDEALQSLLAARARIHAGPQPPVVDSYDPAKEAERAKQVEELLQRTRHWHEIPGQSSQQRRNTAVVDPFVNVRPTGS
ncbi:hypothetical protein [Streptomyces tauricus]|uniref:hypothetical protein n=1 Tax=Streptomyces tauricus TaxID=68274 RepID=UPI002244AE21|nr:hypothetical protein [Streptomyces tauricus]MCW8103016.1 hypothetical protein [Streptomyces tauricus]